MADKPRGWPMREFDRSSSRAVPPDLLDALEALLGEVVDSAWLEQVLALAMAYLHLLAPCKKDEWLGWDDLPVDVQTIVIAAIVRHHSNPRGIRQETIGEYSYTLDAGVTASNSGGGPFSRDEARLVSAIAGCGGSFKSVKIVSPDVLPLDTPELGEVSMGGGHVVENL